MKFGTYFRELPYLPEGTTNPVFSALTLRADAVRRVREKA
jgi:hypothetical protein